MNLDRELAPHYQFFAQATDGGGRWCRAEVKLTVTDVNDNPPIFTLSQYTASVYEDTTPKALLTRIQAIDPDEGNAKTMFMSTAFLFVLPVLPQLKMRTLHNNCIHLLHFDCAQNGDSHIMSLSLI